MKSKTKAFFSFFLKASTILVVFALAGTILLAISYLFPTEQIDKHVEYSSEIMAEEGTYPHITQSATSKLDNFTDSWMLLNAAYSDNESVFVQAMNVKSFGISDLNPQEILVAHYRDKREYDYEVSYSRYWHGYLIFLKPLLMLFSYKKIRILNCILLVSVIGSIIFIFVKRHKKYLIAPFLITILFFMPVAIAKSIQFSTSFYVAMIGVLSIILTEGKSFQKRCLIFLILGILTAFFDLLTYPLVTLGIPAVIYFSEHISNGKIKDSIKRLIGIAVSWGVGYIGMWGSKWVIGSIITGTNIISNAISQIMFRSSSLEEYSRLGVLRVNVEDFFHTPASALLVIFITIMITLIVVYWRNSSKKIEVKKLLIEAAPFIIIMCIPFVWYFVVSNHSGIHHWFTNKLCTISIFAFMCALLKIYRLLRGKH